MTVDIITFNGIKFRRYPDAEKAAHRAYYTPSQAARMAGIQALHQEVWKAANGRPIPPGHHIHHIDFDHLNNAPENLACVTAEEHRKLHSARSSERGKSARSLEHLARIRPLTVAWHSTPEGIAAHKRNAAKMHAAIQERETFCDQCGQEFLTKNTGTRFCSNNCKSAWRRASGVDDEQRTCAVCSSPFTINRYAKTRTCTRACARKLSA